MSDFYPDFDKIKASYLLDQLHVSPIKIAKGVVDGKLEIVGILDLGKINPKIKTAAELGEAIFIEGTRKIVREFKLALWAWRDEMGQAGGTDLEKTDYLEQQLSDGLRCLVVDRDSLESLINETPPPNLMPDEDTGKMAPQAIEGTIRSIQVGVESEDTLKIRLPGGPFKSFTSDSLGLRRESKGWRVLSEIVSSDLPLYMIGPSSDKRKYDARQKLMQEINKKLIAFFNTQFSLGIPQDFNFFELSKADGTGVYRLKFKTCVDQNEDEEFKEMSRDDLMNSIRILSDKSVTLAGDTALRDEFRKKLYEAIRVATMRGLMTKDDAKKKVQELKKEDAEKMVQGRKPT